MQRLHILTSGQMSWYDEASIKRHIIKQKRRGSLGTIISNMFALGSLFTYSVGYLIPRYSQIKCWSLMYQLCFGQLAVTSMAADHTLWSLRSLGLLCPKLPLLAGRAGQARRLFVSRSCFFLFFLQARRLFYTIFVLQARRRCHCLTPAARSPL